MIRRLAMPLVIAAALCGCQAEAPQAAASGTTASTAPFAYAEVDITGLQARMTAGEVDSTTLTRAYLDRIAAIDRAGPRLRAIIELNPDALKEAARLDEERRNGRLRGPLHGIPLVIKDNIGALPMSTTAGSLALEGFRPEDAFVVSRLRDAGAVILGKTNLSEWANFRSTRSTSGWSARGGQTRNPYSLTHNPCGSSSGTAAAVAANLAVAGVGTETDGSIACPAAVTGLVGLKPTVGLVSRSGIIPISFSQDTAGPMTRNVRDAALLLSAMAGHDPGDPATATRPGQAVFDLAARLDEGALRGARLGLVRNPLNEHPAVAATLDQAVQVLRDAGATVIQTALPTDGEWDEAELQVLLAEFKAGLERYLVSHEAPIQSLAELIEFNQRNADRELVFFGQELLEQAQAAPGLSDPAYIEARMQARRLAGPQGIDAALQADRLDALIVPTTGPAWVTDPVNGDDFPGAGYSAAAVAGYPSITVPMGSANGLPLGLLFMGKAWSEPRLLNLAYAYEQRTRARVPPALDSAPLP